MATYRERREAKAVKLQEWAAKREADAAAVFEHNRPITSDWAFITQPGHIPIRAKIIAQEDRALASINKARGMVGRAVGIEQQLAQSIYSDDPDALEQLAAKVARLEADRERMKTRNAAYRKEHAVELRAMTPYERSQAVPYAAYELQNLGGNITRTRQRLAQLQREAAVKEDGGRGHGRPMESRYPGTCPECNGPIARGAAIVYYRLTREALHADCVSTA